MRIWRARLVATLGVVALLSLGATSHAVAQRNKGAAARTDAADTLVADGSQARPGGTTSRRPVLAALVDEETTWFPSPPAAPETFETAGVLQCVPYARYLSGIGLRGDAWTWWDNAAGLYARGNHPEPGAVLSFPGIERMPLGHVAVVTQVLTARTILINHANWPNAFVRHGAISHDIEVVDVSAANDWTEVRVQFGEGGPLGSIYPANGFIYEWNESGVPVARPKFSLDYALWSPAAPTWRVFNSIAYLWALPPAARKLAYAAAGVTPNAVSPVHGKPALVLGQVGPVLNAGALGRTLSINRLDVAPGRRAGVLGFGRFVIR